MPPPGLEIHARRLHRGQRAARPAGGRHAAAGRELPGAGGSAAALEVELLKEGGEVDRGVGANVLDSPLLALGHLVELLARQPEAPPLAAGEIITTGTLTDAHPVAPGETWSTADLAACRSRACRVRFG